MGDEVMMIDAATAGQRARVKAALEYAQVDRVNVAFNTHPHDDHIVGFQYVPEAAAIDKMIITFPEGRQLPHGKHAGCDARHGRAGGNGGQW